MKKLVLVGFLAILASMVGCAHSETPEADQALADLKQPPVTESSVDTGDGSTDASAATVTPDADASALATSGTALNTAPVTTIPMYPSEATSISTHHKRHHRAHKKHVKKHRRGHHAKRKGHRKHRPA